MGLVPQLSRSPGTRTRRGPGRGTAAVEVPVPERECDHVRRPDLAASGEQTARVSGEDLVVGQDLRDEPTGGEKVRQGQERDDDAGDSSQPGFLPVDAAWVPGYQHGQQPELYGRDHPGGLDPVAGWQRHMQAGCGNDRQGDRPPVLAPLGWSGRRELNRGLAGRSVLCGHIP